MAVSGTELRRATEAAGAILGELGLAAYVFAIEPRDDHWELKLECAVKEGWEAVTLPVEIGMLLKSLTDSDTRASLVQSWRAKLASGSSQAGAGPGLR